MERLIEKLFSECVKRELEDDDLKIMREQKVLLLAGENSSLDLNIPAHYIVKKVSEEFFSENAPGSTTCKTCGHGHGHGRSEDMPTSGGKEEEDVAAEPQSCSICVDLLVHGGERSITKLPCQHEFHFDCIAAIYMARGRMQCPICSHVEKSALDQLCRPRGQMLCYNWRHIENGYTTRLIAIRSGRVGDVVIDGGPYIDFEDLYQVSSEQNNASARSGLKKREKC
ncbi:hypothetical protein MPTK1_3g20610 [Marchantia polymorpha subsp. ruderalis]|uniref:RING-type domain-containing protein n=2 Tax=Marchantia polymorpha TaxID=3197 RepID=A0AAF6B2Z4_MARPO|nr:hypothetical protein MARPO_0149s0027 [Marchantia polymorpha]BBN06378.1 hypothetical protein Mp_3g20610 [Marchantia polymorpha subsp. ruderalis]|eukprot:PTQ29034.1 hypothetical protein MARPO_0149s0027 [Marchantia polymorpha]